MGHLGFSGKPLERILAQLVGVCVKARDFEGLGALKAQVPQQITRNILAYNLACGAAREKDKGRADAAHARRPRAREEP